MKVTLLGCGGSQGVPNSAGDWGQCDPADPRNRRLRPSVLVETATPAGETRRILIDTGPDLREQLLRAGVNMIDAILYTHAHADHIHGIDDLRAINKVMNRAIPFWATATVMEQIKTRFAYAIEGKHEGFYRPTLLPHVFDGPFEAAGIPVIPFTQDHGFTATTGFRIGDFGYSTDVVQLDEAAFTALDGITTWIVDCVRLAPHPTHSHLERTLGWIGRLKPARAVLTHMDGSLDYAALAALLPDGVEPGRDGLVLPVGEAGHR
jgi:phosphoribosyl 1,2-cyclic phosphate phosphodiesterase